ncbi:hypothetical protein M407DRAFT_28577 [Tulasnella calospora MUT 4182]|uniref:Uncharacterized protein n=1 Tax=Tulasnella calospora MUT 4182 TaxID=1051891 RepID=A0A0C3QAI2_9AGAM|nr:hypothetical protein M407DRAFT_28577 [Tulasnella calospora MUT 4182]
MASIPASSNFRRSNDGISLTKTQYKPGKHSVVKYEWAYHDRSPERFLVIFFDVKLKIAYIADNVKTRQNGNGKGKGEVDLDALNENAGKYTLRLTNVKDTDDVFAESEPFVVKQKDF